MSDYFTDVSSLHALTDVHLGMTYRDLQKERAAAVAAPYVGMQERIGPDSVRYRFDQGTTPDVEELVSLRAIRRMQLRP